MNAGPTSTASFVVYGLAHAVVDALSAGVVITLWQGLALTPGRTSVYFTLYNAIAFGAQPLVGLLVDAAGRPRAAAVFGCAIAASAAALSASQPWLAVAMIGLGNAVFHVGAGSLVIQLTPRRATGPGLFVAPGAIGLFAGTWLAGAGTFDPWPVVAALTVLGVAMSRLAPPPTAGGRPEWPAGVTVTVALLLACIAARSLVGFAVAMPWKASLHMAILAVGIVALGKGLGGVLADRFGWGRVSVGALAIATPLLAFGAARAPAGLGGLLLLNLTMPVTLAATANLFPGRPAFAFGLTCLALEFGAWPVTQSASGAAGLGLPWVVFALGVGAAGALYLALRRAALYE